MILVHGKQKVPTLELRLVPNSLSTHIPYPGDIKTKPEPVEPHQDGDRYLGTLSGCSALGPSEMAQNSLPVPYAHPLISATVVHPLAVGSKGGSALYRNPWEPNPVTRTSKALGDPCTVLHLLPASYGPFHAPSPSLHAPSIAAARTSSYGSSGSVC